MPLADAAPVAFIVTLDRPKAEAFYGETLGLRRLPDEPYAAVFDMAGSVPLRLTQVLTHIPRRLLNAFLQQRHKLVRALDGFKRLGQLSVHLGCRLRPSSVPRS